MRYSVVFALLPMLALGTGGKKSKDSQAPRLEVLEFAVKRTVDRTIEIDGRIRNCGQNAIHKLVLRFKILSPDDEIVATQLGAITPDVLEAGDEAEFHWQMRDPARAVALRIEAVDHNENVLGLDKPGPYTIE
ncbi:MAG: hypothetical protein ACLQGV_21285 [Bryobacteraceae bacterium]